MRSRFCFLIDSSFQFDHDSCPAPLLCRTPKWSFDVLVNSAGTIIWSILIVTLFETDEASQVPLLPLLVQNDLQPLQLLRGGNVVNDSELDNKGSPPTSVSHLKKGNHSNILGSSNSQLQPLVPSRPISPSSTCNILNYHIPLLILTNLLNSDC